jgi:K+-sensing histidine kinase KdpD
MVVVIVAVAAVGDRVAGVLAAVSAGVWFDFFLTRPYERFAISHRPDIETTILLFVVGVAVTEITARARHHRIVASEESGHVAQLHSVARMMAQGEDARIVIARAEEALASLLELRSCRYDPDPGSDAHPGVISQEGDVVLAGLHWNWLPGQLDLPVEYQGRGYGRFVLVPTPGVPVPRGRRLVAVALADEVGAVLAGAQRPAQ